MEAEIKAEFEKAGFSIEDEEQVLQKCLTSCINYNLKPSDLLSSWELYYLNRQINGSIVENAEMDGFLMHLQNEKKEAIIKQESHLHFYSSNDVEMILSEEHEDRKEGTLGTPPAKSEKLNSDSFDATPVSTGNTFSSRKSLKLETPFGQRKRKCVVQLTLNNLADTADVKKEEEDENLVDDFIRRAQPSEKCSLLIQGSKPKRGCRFMYDKIEDRFNYLESRITKHGRSLVSSGIYSDPVDPTVASQTTVFAVGMICCDGEGRLNDKSVMLQSSVEHSGGQRVRVDLQQVGHFSFFPGQMVGIEGHNPSGHCLIASKVLDCIPFMDSDMNLPRAKKQALDQELQTSSSPSNLTELSVIIAAGPYTTTDNLLFEPLTELLAYASRKMPQLLILLGPFVDSDHPEINNGTVDVSFDDLFRLEVLRRLKDYVEYIGSAVRVILVPSTRDANHDFVFPQPAFDIPTPDLNYQISSCTNPGTFVANEVKVGCCTLDILKHLSGEEISRTPADGSTADGDRRSRLAKHILKQRSFYPLYPQVETVPLDFSLAPEALQITSIPDILILPSDLTYFVKVLSLGGTSDGEEQVKCLCVNPGRLSKGLGAGTFAEINYNGNPDTTSASIITI